MTAKLLHQHQACKVPRPQHPLPKAIWRKLVLELKVPQQLSQLCSTAAQQRPRTAAVVAAYAALHSFLIKAFIDGMVCRDIPALSNTICDAICQQVEQSGALQLLPAVLAAAADELDTQLSRPVQGLPTQLETTTATAARTGAGPAGSRTAAASGSTKAAWSSTGSKGSFPSGTSCTTQPRSCYSQQIESHSQELLGLAVLCMQQWKSYSAGQGSPLNAAFQAAAAEACRLLLSGMRKLSSSMQPDCDKAFTSADIVDLLARISLALSIITVTPLDLSSCSCSYCTRSSSVGPSVMHQQPHVQRQVVLSSPHTLPALVTAIAVIGYSSIMLRDGKLVARGSLAGAMTTGGSNGSNYSETCRSAAAAAAMAGSPQQRSRPVAGTAHASTSKSSHQLARNTASVAPALSTDCNVQDLPPVLQGGLAQCQETVSKHLQAAANWEPVVTPCQRELFDLLGLHPMAVLLAATDPFGDFSALRAPGKARDAIERLVGLMDAAHKQLLVDIQRPRGPQHHSGIDQPDLQSTASRNVQLLSDRQPQQALAPERHEPPEEPAKQQHVTPEQQKDSAGLLLLLPTVLLHWAAQHQPSSQPDDSPVTCGVAAAGSYSALYGWQNIATLQAGSSSIRQQMQHLPSSWWDGVLPVLLKLLSQLLQQEQAEPLAEQHPESWPVSSAAAASIQSHAGSTAHPGASSRSTDSSSSRASTALQVEGSSSDSKASGTGSGTAIAAALAPGSDESHLSDELLSQRQNAILSLSALLRTLQIAWQTEPLAAPQADPVHPLSPQLAANMPEETAVSVRVGASASSSSAEGSLQDQPAAQHLSHKDPVLQAPDHLVASKAATNSAEASSSAASSSALSRTPAAAAAAPAVPLPAVMLTSAIDILTCIESCIRAAARWKPSILALGRTQKQLHDTISLCQGASGPLVALVRRTGPGSPQQQQLYGLLASLMKAGDVNSQVAGRSTDKCRVAAADAAIALLAVGNGTSSELGPPQATPEATSQSCSSEASSAGGEAAADVAASGCNGLHKACDDGSGSSNDGISSYGGSTLRNSTAASGGSSSVSESSSIVVTTTSSSSSSSSSSRRPSSFLAQLPSLAIFGRCCLAWAGQLEDLIPFVLHVAEPIQAAFPGKDGTSECHGLIASLVNCSAISHNAVALCFAGEQPVLLDWVDRLRTWLQQPAITAELSATGYNPQQLLQALDALLAALLAARGCKTDETLDELAQQLDAVGEVFSAVAVLPICNNPSCANMSGLTELSLVTGRSCMCGACRIAHYCSRPCQQAHWKQHKPACKALLAVAAADKLGQPMQPICA